MVTDVPTGTVTFLFTDLEASTRLWEEHPEAMKDALARHDSILRGAVDANGGHVVKATGDGVHAAFGSAQEAAAAALDAQRELTTETWPETGPLRIRMGIHTGEAEYRDGDYYGGAVNRAARITDAAHGGQILCSLATEELIRESLRGSVTLIDLGEHHLRDLSRPERLFQLQAPDLRSTFPPGRSLEGFPGNLPRRTTSFIGREDEVRRVGEALDRAPIVTLTGVGGVGKTRLAVQAAADVLPRYPHGAWFCELAPVMDSEALTQVVATTLGMPTSSVEAITEFLRAKRLLLILDNCEHLLTDACDLAVAVTARCPSVRILATSREGLGVDGEQVLPLRSLAVESAAQLFVDRCRASTPDFEAIGAAATAIDEICGRLDGIPLAIELAAARVPAMSPTEIAGLLDERFRLLTGGGNRRIERHQTLRGAVDWSYSLLGDAERAVFDRLSVFAAAFSSESATAVVSGEGVERFDVLDALTSLVAKSMLVAEPAPDGTTRYRLLETLRQYGQDQLEERDELLEYRRHHAAYFADVAEGHSLGLLGPDELAVREHILNDRDDLRAAVHWGLDADDPADLALAGRTIATLPLEASQRRATGVGLWAQRALDRVDELDDAVAAGVVMVAAIEADQRHDPGAVGLAETAYEQRHLLPPHIRGAATTALAMAVPKTGDFGRAIRIVEDSLEEIGSGTDPVDLFYASCLHALNLFTRLATGDLEQAYADGIAALELAQEVRNPTAIALANFGLGSVARERGLPGARAALEEAVALCGEGAIEEILNPALTHLALVLVDEGDPRAAIEIAKRLVGRLREGASSGIAYQVAMVVGLAVPKDGDSTWLATLAALEAGASAHAAAWTPESESTRLEALATEMERAISDPSVLEPARKRGRALSTEELMDLTEQVADEALSRLDRGGRGPLVEDHASTSHGSADRSCPETESRDDRP